jgi:lipid A disaccharide synthetase
MLVLLPLNKPESIPLEGPFGLIGQIPVLGTAVKRVVVPRVAERVRFVSLINMIADREITPEIRGVLQPLDLVEKIEYLTENKEKLSDMGEKLKEAAGIKGAARLLVETVAEVLASYH